MKPWLLPLGLIAALAPAAFGHARLLKSEPPAEALLGKAPAVVRAWFDDELEPKGSTITVWDARGRRVDDGKGGVDLNDLDRKSMVVRLAPLAPGAYTVKWRAVSADDQNVATGVFRFAVSPPR